MDIYVSCLEEGWTHRGTHLSSSSPSNDSCLSQWFLWDAVGGEMHIPSSCLHLAYISLGLRSTICLLLFGAESLELLNLQLLLHWGSHPPAHHPLDRSSRVRAPSCLPLKSDSPHQHLIPSASDVFAQGPVGS